MGKTIFILRHILGVAGNEVLLFPFSSTMDVLCLRSGYCVGYWSWIQPVPPVYSYHLFFFLVVH